MAGPHGAHLGGGSLEWLAWAAYVVSCGRLDSHPDGWSKRS